MSKAAKNLRPTQTNNLTLVYPKGIFTGVDFENYFLKIKDKVFLKNLFFAFFLLDTFRQLFPELRKVDHINEQTFVTYCIRYWLLRSSAKRLFNKIMSKAQDTSIPKQLRNIFCNKKGTVLKLYPRHFSTQIVFCNSELISDITSVSKFITLAIWIYAYSPIYSFTDRQQYDDEDKYAYRDRIFWSTNSEKPTPARYQCSYWYAWWIVQSNVTNYIKAFNKKLKALSLKFKITPTYKYVWNGQVIRGWNIYTTSEIQYKTNKRYREKQGKEKKHTIKWEWFKIDITTMRKYKSKVLLVGRKSFDDHLQDNLSNYRSEHFSEYMKYQMYKECVKESLDIERQKTNQLYTLYQEFKKKVSELVLKYRQKKREIIKNLEIYQVINIHY